MHWMMQRLLSRFLRSLFAFILISAIASGGLATAQSVKKADATPWLYVGSDIPPDPAWKFGVLPNGLRYAVRSNGVPPHQVSIRIGMEAGSLMESEKERGFAHFIEHLVFRGSAYLSDGEAKRVWQRLGASFGSDTNASTTNTQTIYKIDLPEYTQAGLEESIKILSGMMIGPTLTQAEVDAERRTVLAEAREQFGPDFQVSDATLKLFFAGQLFANRAPIGTVETLQAATPAAIRAFHDRWYRPERAIIAIAGDGDPELYERLLTKYFGPWQGKGAFTSDPDFGKPAPTPVNSAAVSAPGLSLGVQMAWMRPWFRKDDTVAYNRGKLVDLVALRLINRRLETAARAGSSYLSANVSQDDVARSVDGTFVSVVPIGTNWQAAVRDVRAVIADALANPSALDEIKREANEFDAALQISVETQRTEPGSKQADDLIEAVNIRETVATAEVAKTVFTGLKDDITPAMVLASTKRLFGGIGPRAIISSAAAIPDAQAHLARAISEPVQARATSSGKPVTFTNLPKLGLPGRVVSSKLVPQLDLTLSEFANGVRFVHFANPAESGKIYIAVRFGRGMQALPSNGGAALWAAGLALNSGGIGKLNQDQLDRMTSGRKINTSFEIGDNAFVLRGETRQADLGDQLRLLAAKLSFPAWDAAPVARARAGFLAGYQGFESSPQAILSRDLSGLLHGKDPRWMPPTKTQIEALTPKAFRSLWEPLLKTGPIEVMVFGDVTKDEAEAAVAASFGAMKARAAAKPLSLIAKGPIPNAQPLLLHHKGPMDQAAAVLAWETGGGIANSYESRKLDMLAQILFDQLREAEGQSYSPIVDSSWPTGFDSGGNFAVIAQLKPEGVAHFYTLARSIATDLQDKPVTADELQRAITPMKERISRYSTGSLFWLRNLEGVSFQPERVEALKRIFVEFSRISPDDLQEVARRWLKPEKEFRLTVLPEGK
jgi:zinc protease